jgi:MerR family transcriptional regulator, light-induced transcriptional regulator
MIQTGRQLADAGAQIGDPAGLRLPASDKVPSEDDAGGACAPAEEACLERLRLLVSTVESQIIPRLVIAHRSPGSCGSVAHESAAVRPRRDEVEQCTRLLLDPYAGSVADFAEGLIARGLPLDAVYLDVFAPSARRLGDLWTRDECSFADVTIALGRLQQALRRFAPHFRPESIDGEPWRRALFAAAPGEQHTLGLSMIVQYFLRAGWDTSLLPNAAEEDLTRLVQQERVALVGISMSDVRHAPVLKALIGRVRGSSRNGELRVIVGGFAFSDRPGLAAEVGADGTATDAQQAVNLAQQLVL